ncbi:heparan-alpha-glucosaminide N-acetyltransferase domain-containing protein [Sandaracinus amylolyticus]|uniref:heparan-alpha-glucosaminide N-acetyltransferase domain-containing protein n=1 Tax=Sandaracinus amylolyticus TaxID=927083 RepID=UPI001F31C1F0|nr:heparan-alpha-glucosaminide N-acetyltransferase domain-containing protein [Sandaracinus amylolyticus]UJR86630.1 Hypothetical protein I5071_87310 [Sandaracinus amylolyticus]
MAASVETSKETKKGGRWLALDLLRFCAVFLMVQGHTFTELLDPAVRAERWYRHHMFVHGYTAPMFLFASGLAFGYTTFRTWDANLRPGPALWKRFRRYGWLLIIGYALHLPSTSLQALMNLSPERLNRWLQVDVLQHIAISLAICQLLVVVLRTPRRFAIAVGTMFTFVVLAAPIVWRWQAHEVLHPAISGFVNSSSGSLFPLVPWAGFTYAGILCAYFARDVAQPARTLAWPFAIVTALVLLVPIAINHTLWNPYGVHDFWKTSPYFFFWRLGNVLAVLTLLCFAERWMERAKVARDPVALSGRALTMVRVVGQESLIVYVGHLLVLHGSVLNRGIRAYTGETLSLGEATFVALALFVAMLVLARVWHELKKREVRFQAMQLAAASAFVWMLVTG